MKTLLMAWRQIRYGTWLMAMGIDPAEAIEMAQDAYAFGHLDY